MQDTFPFEAMKETHEQCKTKIDVYELKSGTTIITLLAIVFVVSDDQRIASRGIYFALCLGRAVIKVYYHMREIV
jgi:hypothetical protein